MAEIWFWSVLLGVLGLVFGSFIATIAIRWPAERSILKGRSACDSCGKELAWYELVPVASYAVQLGNCRTCAAPIKPGHVEIELIAAIIGVVAGIVAPGVDGAAGAVFGWLLLALAALDLRAFWMPNELTGALAATGVLTGIASLQPELFERLIGGLAGFFGLLLAASAYRVIRGKDGLGGGDPKMLGGIGLWLGWRMLPWVLLGACVIGLAYVGVMRLRGVKLGDDHKLPFGVYLAVAAFVVWIVERFL
ncbi:prepilin peptidase [Sphingomonas sp. LB-2]|uniref:prepilin peptidase n=1 Tax=Sphingomonas caeni TaxID=2984949 RepID=UPI0022304075|nr:A24 family peptidase [Sphingomonas caeni]MCW3849303.1 prepilin peptidase [Sphingomonas caeni]